MHLYLHFVPCSFHFLSDQKNGIKGTIW